MSLPLGISKKCPAVRAEQSLGGKPWTERSRQRALEVSKGKLAERRREIDVVSVTLVKFERVKATVVMRWEELGQCPKPQNSSKE